MSKQRFEGRVLYITGGASGVGRATALLFAAEGASVFAADVNAAGLDETVGAIREAGGTAASGTCDVTSRESVESSVASAIEAFGAIHVLVNAAGIGRTVRFEDIGEAEWERTFAVNVGGPYRTMQATLPHLLESRGVVVNVASIAAMRGQAYNAHYSASKGALLNLTRSFALEFTSKRLRANCVSPGGILTPMIANFAPGEGYEEAVTAYYSPPVPGRMSKPEDIAQSIAFLASDDAKMVNGAALLVDGGTLA